MDRRKRQFGLFLVAVVLSAAALSILTYRFLRQDAELARQREPEQRLQAVEQARRELIANLEKITLLEINRRVTASESTLGDPADSAIVLATPSDRLEQLVSPWKSPGNAGAPSPGFVTNQDAGETLEFQSRDYLRAATAYRLALAGARRPEESCQARLGLGRSLVKAGRNKEAAEEYRGILRACDTALDELGIPFSFYATDRLIALKLDIPLAEDYLVKEVRRLRLHPLPQATMIHSQLQSIGSEGANQALAEIAGQIRDGQQVTTLVKEIPRLVEPLADQKWVAFGEEPWLLKLTETPPLLLAISSRKVAPPGTTLTAAKSSRSYKLDEGFSGLQIELDPNRSFAGDRAPAALIAAGIGFIVVLTFLSAYLLLRGVNRDLQMAEVRSHFVASVSHELKTPLTAIRMFAETLVLGRARDEGTRSEYLETIMNESERLARLVDNVLDFSKIEQGKKIYRMRRVALPDVVKAAARAMQYPLEQQGFKLNVSIAEDLPSMPADSDALEQAILNLLSNAMKYSGSARQIELCCARNNGNAVIAVTDHGIGIAPQDKMHIFEKFYRVRSSDTDLIAGTGLGLTLVKHVVQAHAGSVDVESTPGRGSTFSIRIPMPPEVSA
jgi:signal transduction histidine kinase